jgi:hypothetical protein
MVTVILGTGRDVGVDPVGHATVGEFATAVAARAGLTEGTFSVKLDGVVLGPDVANGLHDGVVELVDVSGYTWPDVETELKVGEAIDGERTQVGPTHAPDGEMHELTVDE